MYQFLTKKSHSNPDFCPFGSNCITKETQQEGQQDSKRKGNLKFLSVSVTTQKSEHALYCTVIRELPPLQLINNRIDPPKQSSTMCLNTVWHLPWLAGLTSFIRAEGGRKVLCYYSE